MTGGDLSPVLAANRLFYAALERRDYGEMEGLWSHRDDVACTHPGWRRLDGWEEVSRGWRAIFANSRAWRVRSEEERAFVSEGIGVVLCVEVLEAVGTQGEPARMQATNVFRKEGSQWLLVHHHASATPEQEDDEEEEPVN